MEQIFITAGLFIKEMRVHHYIKNALVLCPLFFSGNFFNKEKIFLSLPAFLSFSFISSAVYVVNDIFDKEKDSLHPVKRLRPVASGKISLRSAWVLFFTLTALAVSLSLFLNGVLPFFLILLYFTLNLAYSFGAKNIPFVDIFILVSGFFIRVLLGSVVSECRISDWFYLTVISASLCMALGKRRGELLKTESKKGETRKVLKFYTHNFLDKNIYSFITMINIFYALWAIDKKESMTSSHSYFFLTVPLVIFITLRYSFDIEGKSDGDPVEVLIHDKILLVLCFLFALFSLLTLYL